MNFKENNKAIYLQIADKICDDILSGELQPGSRIPSVRDYASSLEVNANTVMRSYELLDRQGIIFNRRGIGFFITDTARDTILSIRREALTDGGELSDFFRRLMLLEISPDRLKSMYENFLNDNPQ